MKIRSHGAQLGGPFTGVFSCGNDRHAADLGAVLVGAT
jgi:hypothetical protein